MKFITKSLLTIIASSTIAFSTIANIKYQNVAYSSAIIAGNLKDARTLTRNAPHPINDYPEPFHTIMTVMGEYIGYKRAEAMHDIPEKPYNKPKRAPEGFRIV